ncbi:MAG: sensor domain-containing diguanylate cyclase [Colwellia sp.]|nr:sensor domain-containing diguanylate cyclase [Colwellia sp.]
MLSLTGNELSQKIFEFSNDGILILSIDENRIIEVNPAVTKMLGFSREDLLSMNISNIQPRGVDLIKKYTEQVITNRAEWTNELTFKTKSDKLILVEVSASIITIDNQNYLISMVRDIGCRKQIEEQLRLFSFTDGLTGIANRRKLDEYMDIEWRRAIRYELPISVIMIDIDYFKPYNDTYGHLQGDICLKAVASIIQKSLIRPGDLCARYGGEEFIVLLSDTDEKGSLHIANKINCNLANEKIKHCKSDINTFVTVSMGLASIVPTSKNTSSQLISKADQALYQAKREGRNKIIRFLEDENYCPNKSATSSL